VWEESIENVAVAASATGSYSPQLVHTLHDGEEVVDPEIDSITLVYFTPSFWRLITFCRMNNANKY
jgi:hypothetical protein